MKEVRNYITMIVVFTALWIILNEKAGPIQLLTGVILSLFAISFTNYYLILDEYTISYSIPTSVILKYSIYLILQIYISGFSSIGVIIRGDSKVKIVEYQSCIEDDLSICLLANAITLTPGTVTIDKTGNKLKILCFDSNDKFKNPLDERVCTEIEKILRGRN